MATTEMSEARSGAVAMPDAEEVIESLRRTGSTLGGSARIFAALLVGAIVWPSSGLAQEPPYVPPSEHAVLLSAGEVAWHAEPDGTEVAVLYGNPAQEGPYVLRVRFPANWEMPFHWHPTGEFTTVLEGTLHLALGRDARREAARAYGPGSFAAIPAFVPIRAWTESAVVELQVHGTGPLVTVPLAHDR